VHSRDRWQNASQCLFDHMWSCFDLLTSKSNQFTFVTNCTKFVKKWNSNKQFVRYCGNKLIVYYHTHTHTRTECIHCHSSHGTGIKKWTFFETECMSAAYSYSASDELHNWSISSKLQLFHVTVFTREHLLLVSNFRESWKVHRPQVIHSRSQLGCQHQQPLN